MDNQKNDPQKNSSDGSGKIQVKSISSDLVSDTSSSSPAVSDKIIEDKEEEGKGIFRDSLSRKPVSSLGSRFGSLKKAEPKDPHEENLKVLREAFGEDRIKENESMKNHTTFRIGGEAEFFFEAETIDELIKVIVLSREFKFLKKKEDVTEEDREALKRREEMDNIGKPKTKGAYGLGSRFGAKKEPKYQLSFLILGVGSNILVSDKGVSGLVVKNKASKVNIGGEIAEAYSGTPTGLLIQKTLDNDLKGLEFLDGIPGTIGGAICSNAKAFFLGDYLEKPKSIHEVIYDLTIINKDGRVLIKTVDDYRWHLTFNNIKEVGDIILVARFKLEKGLTKAVEKYLADYHVFRKNKPYVQYPSVGSVFRNPEGSSAGKLIDECGLKGLQKGMAKITEEHGNIFLNLGGATAEDMRYLIEMAKTKVQEKFGISLKEEITYVGDFRSEEEISKIKADLEKEEEVEEENNETEDDFSDLGNL